MKNFKKLVLPMCFIIATSCALAVGCGGKTPPDEGKDPETPAESTIKPVTGIDPIFVDQIGLNNESPAVIEKEGVRYLYYTKNSEAMGGHSTVALRKGTKSGTSWTYGDASIVLTPSEDGAWDDSHVFAPAVVQGKFTLDGTDYSYLMAYAGAGVTNIQNAQIGLAVSNSLESGWKKVGDPVITYDRKDYSSEGQLNATGATEPSLVSFDKEGKVYLFYSLFAPSISATARFVEFDFSDLDNVSSVKAQYGSMVAAKGADDATADPSLLNADFAFKKADGEEYATLYAVKDNYPVESSRPMLPASVSLFKGGEYEALYRVVSDKTEADNLEPVWTSMGKIDFRKTAILSDEARKDGYARIFSAAIVKDSYGYMLSDTQAEIVFSASPTSQVKNFAYAKSLHSLVLTLY